jgi:hypothetical protein
VFAIRVITFGETFKSLHRLQNGFSVTLIKCLHALRDDDRTALKRFAKLIVEPGDFSGFHNYSLKVLANLGLAFSFPA